MEINVQNWDIPYYHQFWPSSEVLARRLKNYIANFLNNRGFQIDPNKISLELELRQGESAFRVHFNIIDALFQEQSYIDFTALANIESAMDAALQQIFGTTTITSETSLQVINVARV